MFTPTSVYGRPSYSVFLFMPIPVYIQDPNLDKQTTMAAETLLSLRGEWRPPSPASSVNSDVHTCGASPLRVAREEVVNCTDGYSEDDYSPASPLREDKETPQQLPSLVSSLSVC